MAERIRHSPNAYPRVKDTSKTLEQVDFGPIAKEMGAEEVAGQVLGSVNPVSFFALRERLQSELVSSGGRPGRREPVQRRKVPVTDEEWLRLKNIAEIMRRTGVSAAPGQIAGILLRQRLEQLHPEQEALTPEESQDLESQVDLILKAAASANIDVAGLRPVALELLRDWHTRADEKKR